MRALHPARVAGAAALLAASLAVHAGGPLVVCPSHAAVKYPAPGTVTLNYDLGTLGSRTKTQADTLVTNAVSVWTNVSTATVTLARGPDLPVDVTTANYLAYYGQFSDGKNPVIYDTDGSIVDLLLGAGASDSVLGFAGSAYSGCSYVEGQAVLSGKLSVSDATMGLVITHEVGHLIGLDHSQLDSAQGLSTSNYPLMYPIAYRSTDTLHEDDRAEVSTLYPDTTFATSYGTLSGTFATAGGTPILGANIWASGTGGTFSVVSDYLTAGSGAFDLHLPPGTYTLHAQAIETDFTGGSSVGPYADDLSSPSFQPPLYSMPNGGGSAMSPVTLGGGTPTQITITAGCTGSVPFRIDGTGTLTGNCNVTPPSAPTTVSPTGTITTATPTYTWNAVSTAATYQLLVQNTLGVAVNLSYSASAAGCAAGTGTCSATPSNALSNGATYNWFVNASNAGGTSAWSAARTITVSVAGPMPPATPTTVSPTGTLTTTTPTYTWNASSGATSYMLLVQNTAGAVVNTSYTAAAVGCSAGTGTCSVTPGAVLANGATYNWFVNATNSVGTSAWSAARTITAPAGSLPAVPTLVSPTGIISTATPSFTWNAASGASSYHLVVRNASSTVAIDVTASAAAAGCGGGTGICSSAPGTSLVNGSYSWTVGAINGSGTSTSGSLSFTVSVSTSGPPATPVTITPSGTITTATPTYTWNAASGATSYTLLVQNTLGVAVSASYSPADVGCSSGSGTCSATPSVALSNGANYSWFVNASNAYGTSAWSAPRGITVAVAGPSVPLAPTLITPNGTTTTATPTYTWNASAGATSYYLLVQNTAGVAVSMSLSAAAVGCASGAGTCSMMPGTSLSNGAVYNWFVNASNSLGTSAWSAPNTITVSAAGPSVPLAPVQVSPTGATGTLTPTYTWNASAGATSYYLLVQNTMGVAVGVSLSASTVGCGAGTGTCSMTPSTMLGAATTYVWFVNASNSLGTSAWSVGKTITTP